MEAGGGGSVAATATSSLPPFLSKTYDMVDDPCTDAVVSWSKNSNSFVVWNVPDFSRELLPKYFKHSNFSSFVRQLNTYGFRKVDSDSWEFANESFLRGHKHLLKTVIRRKPSQAQPSPHVPNSSLGSCIKVGKFGIQEEVESLKRDKNILMQELVRLRHQQQSTDNQLQTVSQRVHGMEQRQQQMMSFLAKAMQSPGFVAHLVHQKSDGNRSISNGNKKRRLPNQEEENFARQYSVTSTDGQTVKYEPLIDEAAKAMLRQILKINNASGKMSNVSGFMIDNGTPAMALSEVLPNMSALTEIQSDTGLPDFVPSQEITSENNTDLHVESFIGALGCEDKNTIPGSVDGQTTVGSDELLADHDFDILLDDIHKLPDINDVFWEQFLSDNRATVGGDADDVNSGKDQVEQEVVWDNLKNLNNLTEQLGVLASASTN